MRYCVDWTEQRHHLAGGLGCGLLRRLLDNGWVARSSQHRAVTGTHAGRRELPAAFGPRVAAVVG